VRGQAVTKAEAVAEAERSIDRALTPKKLKLVHPERDPLSRGYRLIVQREGKRVRLLPRPHGYESLSADRRSRARAEDVIDGEEGTCARTSWHYRKVISLLSFHSSRNSYAHCGGYAPWRNSDET
jgi:hypothetical protein